MNAYTACADSVGSMTYGKIKIEGGNERMSMAVHYSSETVVWETPQDFYDRLNNEFHFDVDVCANHENAKCKRYFTEEENGLLQKWTGVVFMNPPYGREIADWIRKAYESAQEGATVVCLIPSRTDAGWWHDYCMKGEIRFVRGRLKFGGSEWNAPFPSAVVIFRNMPYDNRQLSIF